MGHTGDIVFFTTARLENPARLLQRVIDYTGADHLIFVSRLLTPDTSWRRAKSEPVYSVDDPPGVYPQDEDPSEQIGRKWPVDQAAELFVGLDLRHIFYVRASPRGRSIYEAINRDTPETIRGTFWVVDVSVWIGFHDLFEFSEHLEGRYFGRASFSFHVSGHGCPNDWAEFGRRVFDVPEVRSLKADLESIVGPLEQCVYWSV